jgi:hypothetical protein
MPKSAHSLLIGTLAGFLLLPAYPINAGENLLNKLMHKIEQRKNVIEFDEVDIYLEQNYSDGDTEVVLVAQTKEFGLRKLWIFSPRGELVYKFTSPDNSRNLGGREVLVESPEPEDLELVLKAYPQGDYTFIGRDFADQWTYGVATLVHDIPLPATITFPPDGGAVSRYEFDVVWESAVPADEFLIELENQETDEELYVQVPADRNSFRAPEEWLVPGAEYQVSVSVINEHGNLTVIEQYTVALE